MGYQLGNSRQMDLSGPGIDVKLKERKKELEAEKWRSALGRFSPIWLWTSYDLHK